MPAPQHDAANGGGRVIPQPLKWEGTVHVVLPDSMTRLADAAYQDRQLIGLFAVLIVAYCFTSLYLRFRSNRV